MPGVALQNDNFISTRVENSGGHPSMESELVEVRKFVQEKIYEFLKRRQQQVGEKSSKRVFDIIRRLDDALFKIAATEEEYMDLETLESRLLFLFRRSSASNRSQHFPHANSSSAGTMIRTHGIPRSENASLMVTSSAEASVISSTNCSSIASKNVSRVSCLPSENRLSDGPLAYGYEQSPFNMHVNSGGNDIVSLSDLQRYTGQVISTPGYSSSSSNAHNNDKEIPSIALEFANSSLQQRVQVNVQDGNVGSYMGSGTGSGLQQRSYSLANGALNGGSGTTISNIDQANGPETSEDCQPATLHATSHKPSQHNFDQQWGATIQSDAYGISSADSSASTSFCAPVTSSGSAMDNQHWNSLQSIHKIDSSLINNQLNLQATRQAANTEPESIDQRQKMDLQSPDVLQENLGQSHQQHQFQQIEQRQHQLKTSQQHQLLLTDVSSQSQATPDRGSQGKCEPRITQQFQHSQMQNQFQQNSVGNHSGITLTLPYASGSQYICSLPTQTSQQMQLLMHPNLVTADSGSESNCLPSEVQSAHLNRKNQFMNKKRWLLSLLHARGCSRPEGKCPEHNCIIAQQLLRHMFKCNEPQCPYPRCRMSKALVIHYKHCRAPSCSLCVPVKHCWRAQPQKTTPSVLGTLNYSQPSLKRLKIEQACQPLYSESKSSILPDHAFNHPHVKDVDHSESHVEILLPANSEVTGGKMETPINSGLGCRGNIEIKEDTIDDTSIWMPYADPTISKNESSFVEKEVIKIDEDHAKQENVTVPVENPGAPKFGKEKAKGVSLTELFTPEQVQQHLISLRCWVGQSKAKPGKNQAVEHVMKPNSCQLCGVEKLAFEPPPIYCTPCGARIKRNAIYYTVGAGDTRHYFCIPCYNEGRVNTSVVDGTSISKAQLRKKKNDEEIEESWVQCDKCEAWQHQICALFNGRRNDGGQAEYTCPNCYMAQIGRGEREPLPHNAVLGAKDLPRTILSDHIEQRLFRRLKQERQERARLQGRSYDEVPGAEELVIRVVSSADKRMEVKQRFLEIFQDKNYPTEFPYKSKVILLFQKIEGVEVCLFGLYVQEFGSECQQPNHRRVYLSYLDSVKYFRPDIRSFTGEALRTFVYHEILIGYLEYCKRRGFTSCYIWACPPLKGEDYILYCHPEMQKTPKSDKLREWYLSMLRKATKENIVVGLTNLYDHFFLSTGECKSKVTAARLPYFDGDYWPGAAEDMIYQLQQEEDGRKLHKKGITKKTLTRRALKASGLTDISETASKDFQLMHKLGETISRMKEDFIMVHLQHACNHCCILMVSGIRWICNMCKNFQICDTCNEAEQKLEERDKHPTNQKDKHVLCSVEIKDVPADTKDKDEILDSEFFDTRQAYLSLCQGNHYQYDTLRRAKHSSMMLLYHLHNPTAPAFVSTCNVCHLDVDAGQGLRCEICPDYDVCITCYQKDGGINHPHKLTKNPSMADHGAQNKEARQLRILKLRKMLDLLVHASQCPSLHCQYPYCRKLKELFYHGLHCKVRAPGGCVLCQNMWHLLRLHARACKESSCHVPRCRDLKDYFRREQQQSESRRRAAVMEMIRHC